MGRGQLQLLEALPKAELQRHPGPGQWPMLLVDCLLLQQMERSPVLLPQMAARVWLPVRVQVGQLELAAQQAV